MTKLPWAQCPLSVTALAEHCPACQTAHAEADRQAEYGINWYEWVHTSNETSLAEMVRAWWESLTAEDQLERLCLAAETLRPQLDATESAIRAIRKR